MHNTGIFSGIRFEYWVAGFGRKIGSDSPEWFAFQKSDNFFSNFRTAGNYCIISTRIFRECRCLLEWKTPLVLPKFEAVLDTLTYLHFTQNKTFTVKGPIRFNICGKVREAELFLIIQLNCKCYRLLGLHQPSKAVKHKNRIFSIKRLVSLVES